MSIREKLRSEAQKYTEIKQQIRDEVLKLLERHASDIAALDGTPTARKALIDKILHELEPKVRQWAERLIS